MCPVITVLMCVYNDDRFLSASIESILGQSLSDFEFLIIDDASTDDTSRILESFVERDKRVRVINMTKNMGLGYCLNLGVSEAEGEWIARMDSDDIAFPDRLKTQFEFVRQHTEVDVVGSYAFDMNAIGEIQKLRKVPLGHREIVNLIWTNPFIHSTVFFNRDKILAIGSYSKEARKRQDYELWFKCVKNKLGLMNIGEPLLYYRYSEQTLVRNNPKVMFTQMKIGLEGCWLIRAPFMSYIGVAVPFVKSLFPIKLQKVMGRCLLQFDPRAK